jgi:aminoglycoside phosphotransferase (APT) family kinase protein
MKELLQHHFGEIKQATQIKKGFSSDEKYMIELTDGRKFFIKVCDIKEAKRKEAEMSYMKQLEERGVVMASPVTFLQDDNTCIQVFHHIEGQDGRAILHTLSKQTQYDIGYEAGRMLQRIHSLTIENKEKTWEEMFWTKHERYKELLEEVPAHPLDMDTVLSFIHEHKHLLKDRPIVFQHDDYHPANIMIHNEQFEAVIDFGRYDIGDAYQEFYKVALFTRNDSVPFAVGQINGYFHDEGEVPMHFWQLYALYAAMSFAPDIVWTNRVMPERIQESYERLQTIYEDHDGFTRYVPRWYGEWYSFIR